MITDDVNELVKVNERLEMIDLSENAFLGQDFPSKIKMQLNPRKPFTKVRLKAKEVN